MNYSTEAGKPISTMRICFYGAGSMAEAISRGLIENQLTPPGQISMLNRQNKDRLQELNDRYGVQTILQGATNEQFIREADIIFLAMKPKDAAEAIGGIRHLLSERQLVISVIAGLSIDSIGKLIGPDIPVVRSMPNTSSTIGLGVTGISYSSRVSEEQRKLTDQLFQAVGMTQTVDETKQDSITGVSGSGPAYVYYFMEAMMEGAAQLGFDEQTARELVVQTVLGAAEMVRLTGEEPAVLRRKVTSPNGTTQAAIEVMAAGNLKETVMKGMLRSTERAGEIGAELERNIQR
ncbi:pyrroline-5-carboxylate reductase [Paenibacillus protaetiae]|uniref:Pyrroline-5-carboxylate reductase n=1 Tax=Paenibacillus protaetiae TaxID=2509456 RepID=A0A4P6ETY5_9BACL|nr:pyrroline-5-carboxylate reductase [Paenibacillus protaetiae]QAY66116.1 pyrroline-5-carboxylate reductase [Paenibacillus protaetiae]